MTYTNRGVNKEVLSKIIVKGGKKISFWYNEPEEQRQTAFSIETNNNMPMASLMGGWSFRRGGCPLSAGCLNEPSIMRGDCKSSTKPSPQSRPHCLYKIHRESTYKENDREGRVSHWGTEKETEAVTKEADREGWQLSVNPKKKERENAAVWDEWEGGGYEKAKETGLE